LFIIDDEQWPLSLLKGAMVPLRGTPQKKKPL